MEQDIVVQVVASLQLARSAANLQGSTLPTPALRAISRQQFPDVK